LLDLCFGVRAVNGGLQLAVLPYDLRSQNSPAQKGDNDDDGEEKKRKKGEKEQKETKFDKRSKCLTCE
jgi:hypothetical protein